MKMVKLKGIHYRNIHVYNFLTWLKLRSEYNLRYKIARSYINAGESVLDVCSGPGKLKEFIPLGCEYMAMEASPQFISNLLKQGIKTSSFNLHQGLPADNLKVDVVVMLISLCQFRQTSLNRLLEDFKRIGKRIVIIEDVLSRRRSMKNFIQRIMNFLCGQDYFIPMELFTVDEFKKTMQAHRYEYRPYNQRYHVGCYGGPSS